MEEQDVYCEKVFAGDWKDLGPFPESLQWEALVDVLRGRVKVSPEYPKQCQTDTNYPTGS
jgi:hypothetical protein